MEFLRSFLRRHFREGKPVMALRNIGCFLRLLKIMTLYSLEYLPTSKSHELRSCWPWLSRHWVLAIGSWPCLLHPYASSRGGGLKKPLTSFENSRGCRPRCHGLSDLCCHWSGAVEVRSNKDWSGCKVTLSAEPLFVFLIEEEKRTLCLNCARKPLASRQLKLLDKSILFTLFKLVFRVRASIYQ